MTYIHERPVWPDFIWDSDALAGPLAALRHQQGRLLGRMEALGFDLRAEASLATLTDEVVKTSAIEGERLNPGEVRSSIARTLGLDAAGLPEPGRDVDGIVEIMLDATRNHDASLTAERLFGWHAALFPTGRSGMRRITVGDWRTDEHGPMVVVSGPIGKERVHVQAPAADRVGSEMQRFLDWFESTPELDAVLHAGVAHFWFVTIHPFDDGNGRIGRAIAEMALARADATAERFYSMSAAIEKRRDEYAAQLKRAQRGDGDLTPWLAWFFECLGHAIAAADTTLRAVLAKATLWQAINRHPVNNRQRSVINRMMGDFEGHLTTSKYAKLAKCSSDTALRDIQDLVQRGVLVKNPGGGRSTSYRLAETEELDA